MPDSLTVNEIYLSLQGESTFAGLPCIFVRLTACNLRCSYCDTAYAFTEGAKRPVEEIIAEVERPLIRLTLAATRGNQIKAAAMLGLNRNTLRKKIRDLEIPVVRGLM